MRWLNQVMAASVLVLVGGAGRGARMPAALSRLERPPSVPLAQVQPLGPP